MLKKAENRYMIIGGVDSDGETMKTTHVYDFDGHDNWTTGNSFLLLQDYVLIFSF